MRAFHWIPSARSGCGLGGILCLLAGCTSTDPIRGKDRSELLPAGRVRWTPRPTELTSQIRFTSGVEVEATTLRGDFTRVDGTVAYAADLAAVHAVLGAASQRWELLGLVGGAYGDLEIEAPTGGSDTSGLAASFGGEVGWRTWRWLGPYARWTRDQGDDWDLHRLELGLDLRLHERLGLQAAYARQVMQDDYLAADEFRIETEGVHLGVTLRF